MDQLFILLQRLLPQHALSRLLGALAAARGPRGLVHWVIERFVAHYRVDLGEAERQTAADYHSFNDFFTRALKAGARPLCASGIACPADGAVSECGQLQGDRLLQAKGRDYSLHALLAGDAERAEPFRGGDFMTIYLSPRDYHRVHMPLDGRLTATTYIPGDLSDPGELVMEVELNPDTEPPIDQPAETITITFPLVTGDADAADWQFSGFATGFEINVPLEDKMTATLTVKATGNVTQDAANA